MEERRLSAIMFSDVSGYTTMMGMDEQKAIALVKKAREFQESSIRKFNGKLIDDAGDAVLSCFSSATDAVYCAVEIMSTTNRDPDLKLHIGIHLGEVIFADDKVYGDGINIAARIDAVSKAGEICISEDVWKNIKNKVDLKARVIGKKNFKNVSEPVFLYKILTEEGISAKQVRGKNIFKNVLHPAKKNSALIITFILAGIAICLILFQKNGLLFDRDPPLKSVAVLPFINDSPDQENEYFCNGVMEQIILHLQKIEGFRVPSRTSIEPYRNIKESPKKIAGELGVGNLLEGSVQRSGDHIKVNVRLVKAKNGMSIWEDSYNRDMKDIFQVQRDIAIQVAYALNASLSEEDKSKMIEKTPLKLSAYDYYLQARDNHISYSKNLGNGYLDKAIIFYKKAINIDTSYAEAYTGLALAYWDQHYYSSFMAENFLDSVKFLVEKALKINNSLEEAYWLKSQYEYEKGDFNLAEFDINEALTINPNYSLALWFKGILEIWYEKNFSNGLKILLNVIRYEHGTELPSYLRNLGYIYYQLGMYDISDHYNLEYAGISGDSSRYYYYLIERYRLKQDFDKAEYYLGKLSGSDSLNIDFWYESGWIHMMKHEYPKALKSFINYDSLTTFRQNHMHRLGYLYWVTGDKNNAKDFFNEQIIVCNENIKLNRWYATLFKEAYYDLAGIYYFSGDNTLGFNNLQEFGSQQFVPAWMIDLMKSDPLFDSVRKTAEFQSIIIRLSNNLNIEQGKVLKMMEEEGY